MFARIKKSGKYQYLFEGQCGDIGQRGFSKDHRPDLKQMVVGAVIDDKGSPICCEIWPGNTADVKTLIPRKELERRLNNAGHDFEWADIKQRP